MSNKRQAVIDFNRALWRLRACTPSTERGVEALVFAISISVNLVLNVYATGYPEQAFMDQVEAAMRDIFDKEAQA